MARAKLWVLLSVACAALTLGAARPAQACCLCHLFGGCGCAAPAPAATCAPPYQVNYVPQTCYRTMYSSVPVTSYRPVTSSDPCTGCPVTSYMPVTSYVQKPVVVPYTTYRPVYTAAYAPACGCSTCGCSACGTGACGAATATYYAPAAPSCGCAAAAAPVATYYAPAAPSCGCGAAAAAPTATYYAPAAPAATYYAPAAAPAAPSCGCGATSMNYAPSTAGSTAYYPTTTAPTTTYYVPPRTAPTTTYSSPSYVTQQAVTAPATASTPAPVLQSSDQPIIKLPMTPVPDVKPSSSVAPQLLDPAARTTAMPIMRPGTYNPQPARALTASAEQPAPADADGWHAAR